MELIILVGFISQLLTIGSCLTCDCSAVAYGLSMDANTKSLIVNNLPTGDYKYTGVDCNSCKACLAVIISKNIWLFGCNIKDPTQDMCFSPNVLTSATPYKACSCSSDNMCYSQPSTKPSPPVPSHSAAYHNVTCDCDSTIDGGRMSDSKRLYYKDKLITNSHDIALSLGTCSTKVGSCYTGQLADTTSTTMVPRCISISAQVEGKTVKMKDCAIVSKASSEVCTTKQLFSPTSKDQLCSCSGSYCNDATSAKHVSYLFIFISLFVSHCFWV